MLDECIIIIPFYNRINNLLYNVNFCIKNKLKLLLLIDFPKSDKDFSSNLKKFKRAQTLARQFRLKNIIVADKNRGKVIFVATEGLKFLYRNKNFKTVIVLEDDHLLTNKFIEFCKEISSRQDFKIGLGRGQPNVMSNSFTKSLISLPAGSHIYTAAYIHNALTAKLHITEGCLPHYLDEPFRTNLFKNLINLYPPVYDTYDITENVALEMYDKSSELKILFYNLINKVYTYVPIQNLTPYNPKDIKEIIPELVSELNRDYRFLYEKISLKLEINKFTQLNNFIK